MRTTTRLAILVLPLFLGCGRCRSQGAEVVADAATGAGVVPPSASVVERETDVPEIIDSGKGRATAALRAAFQAFGVEVDAATLERECHVDDDGASIDDLEDAANAHGLEAHQILLPIEHVTVAEVAALPAIVVLKGVDDLQDFVFAFRIQGDGVRVLDPAKGRETIPVADFRSRLLVHEMPIPLDDFRDATESSSFRDALRVRMTALSIEREAATALIDGAGQDPSFRGFGALDAAIRKLEGDSARGASGASTEALKSLVACSLQRQCIGGQKPVAPSLWTVRASPKPGHVMVRGTPALSIRGRSSP